nr:MAG TPA: hypothetical protein [Caudoviricetes sp.]
MLETSSENCLLICAIVQNAEKKRSLRNRGILSHRSLMKNRFPTLRAVVPRFADFSSARGTYCFISSFDS